MPFAAPETDLAPAGGRTAFGDPILGTSPATGRVARDIGDSIIAGLQSSSLGLAYRGKLPDMHMSEDAPWYHRLAAAAGGVVGDIPAGAVGGAITARAGPAGALMGAFAVPMAIREGLVTAYNHDHASSWEGAFDIAKSSAIGAAKGAATGAAVFAAGPAGIASKAFGAISSPLARGAAVVGSEVTALTATASALEGHMPTWQDFMDNAILLGGMKSAVGIARSLRGTYAETGKTPAEVLGDAQADPVLKAELAAGVPKTAADIVDQIHKNHPAMHIEMTEHGSGLLELNMFELRNLQADVGKGYGRNAMAEITAEADAQNREIMLTATPSKGSTMTLEKLVDFYEKNGFVPMSEQKWSNAVEMERAPRPLETSRQTAGAGRQGSALQGTDGLLPEAQGVPRAYQPLALEQRIKAALDGDPRPEVIRKSLDASNGGQPLAETGMVKWEYVTDSDTAKGVIREVTAHFEREVETQRRGTRTTDQEAVDGLKLIAGGKAVEHAIGQGYNAAQMRAAGFLLNDAASNAARISEKYRGVAEADLSPAAKLEIYAALERVAGLNAEFAGARAEWGRAGATLRAIKRDPSMSDDAAAIIKFAERKGAFQDMAAAMAAMRDPAQMAAFAKEIVNPTGLQKVIEAWRAGIFSGPLTWQANVMGNVGRWMVDLIEKPVAASLFAVSSKLSGDPLSIAQWRARALSPLYGLQLAAIDGAHLIAEAGRVIKDGGFAPPAKGLTRVYRGESSAPNANIPDWVKQGMKASGAADAQGRWWTKDLEIAKWYMADAGEHGRIVYQDVPTSTVAKSKVADLSQDIKKFSRDPENELYLPQEFVGRGAPLPEQSAKAGVSQVLKQASDAINGNNEKMDVAQRANTGLVGNAVGFSFGMLKIQDMPFRNIGEREQTYIQAVDRATKEGWHPSTKEFREATARYVDDPTAGLSDEAALKVAKAIKEAGDKAVFGEKLGPKLAMVSHSISGTPWEFVFPARRTPANLLDWSVQHIPMANLMSSRWRADWAAGGERAANATARVVVGTALAATAIAMVADGSLTGGGLTDKEMSGTKEGAGQQNYSVKVNDQYYSIQRIEPIAKLFMLVGDIAEIMKSSKAEDREKAASLIVLAFGNATVSTTYMSGLANLVKAVVDPDRYASTFVEGYASSLVPKVIGQPTVMADPHKREVDGALEAIQAQLPFLREKLSKRQDVWGTPAQNDRWFDVMPIATTKGSDDKVRNEAVRLHVAIADAPKYVQEKGPFNPSEQRIKLTQPQRDIFKEVSGKEAMQILAPIVNAPDWERIPDFGKAGIYKDVIERMRKEGSYAALAPDAEVRVRLREQIVNKVIKQAQEADGTKDTGRRLPFSVEGQPKETGGRRIKIGSDE